jgi:glutamyl-Q tRNA(Asp) synthetase
MRIDFHDRLLGPQHLDLEREVGDFILYRADGVYAFHLASAVDDGEYGITDVVRGADLLESSARQIQLLRLLGLPVPHYVHLPVAVDQHGEKLSKQTKAAPVDPTRPLLVLRAVLRFLNHAVPDDVAEATVPDLWRYAVDHWDLQQVGPRLQGSAVD